MTPLSCAALAVDEMGVRIDELENSIGELMAQVRLPARLHLRAAPSPFLFLL